MGAGIGAAELFGGTALGGCAPKNKADAAANDGAKSAQGPP